MLKLITTTLAATVMMTSVAQAGFGRWTIETKRDPFAQSDKVTADYHLSRRSAVFIQCDTSKSGLTVKLIAGWRDDRGSVPGSVQTSAVAMDDKIVLNFVSQGATFGNLIAGVYAELSAEDSDKLIDAMINARQSMGFKDGISNGPLLVKARGSTKAGQSLQTCLSKQNDS